jgi:hypothetical protein
MRDHNLDILAVAVAVDLVVTELDILDHRPLIDTEQRTPSPRTAHVVSIRIGS